MIFPEECSLFNTVSMGKASISYLFTFSRYQTKCVIKFLFKNFKIYLQSSSIAIADRVKEERMEIQKFEYLENEDSFLDEMKNLFHSFWRAIIWWKIKSPEHKLKVRLCVLLFASLLFMSEREHLWNKEKCFSISLGKLFLFLRWSNVNFLSIKV